MTRKHFCFAYLKFGEELKTQELYKLGIQQNHQLGDDLKELTRSIKMCETLAHNHWISSLLNWFYKNLKQQ